MLQKIASEGYLRQAWDNLEKRPYSYGLDDITIAHFRKNLDNYISETSKLLKAGTYKFSPLRLYLKAKGDGDYRPIKIPTVRDRVVQRALVNCISPILDKKYTLTNTTSYAYIKDRNIKAAAEKFLEWYGKGYKYACKADIIKFFDNIDRKLLLEKISSALPADNGIMTLIEEAVANDIANSEYAYYQERTGKAYVPNTITGIAQGSPLSPLLANVYLSGFDKDMFKAGYKMVRYADDFVILTKTKQEAKDAYYVARKLLKKLKLELYDLKDDIPQELWQQDAKYSLARSCQHLEFLGLKFASGKVYPAGSAYKTIMKNVRGVAGSNSIGLTKKLDGISSRIQGWCNSYSFTTLEHKPITDLDEKLETVLAKMLKRHGLKKTNNTPLHRILGIESFQQTTDRIRAKQE